MKLKNNILLMFSLVFLLSAKSIAQPDRSINNKGVDEFEAKNYSDAEANFKKGLEKAPDSFVTNFNLGDALYKQERYDEAINSFQSALGNADDDLTRAKVHHNVGNSLLKSNKIKESIESYKTALKYNPDDTDTKYNLSYALSLLNNQDQNQQQNKDQQNKNDQNQQDQQNQKDQKKDQQNQPQPKDQETQQDNLKQPQQQEAKISKEDAERILEALKNNEKDLQKELRKKTGRPVKTEKDW